jgi:hypothetical protein
VDWRMDDRIAGSEMSKSLNTLQVDALRRLSNSLGFQLEQVRKQKQDYERGLAFLAGEEKRILQDIELLREIPEDSR